MFFDYFHNVTQSSNIREKLCRLCFLFLNKNVSLTYNYYKINKLDISFLLKNNNTNRLIFLSMLVLLEKLTISSFKFLKAKKSILGFGIKKNSIIGGQYSVSPSFTTQFLRIIFDYSLKKLNKWYSFSNIIHKDNTSYHHIRFGINKLLFISPLSLDIAEYNLFLNLFENMEYGIHLTCYTNYNFFLVNRLILSHYGFFIL